MRVTEAWAKQTGFVYHCGVVPAAQTTILGEIVAFLRKTLSD
jgi:hypothetical protein